MSLFHRRPRTADLREPVEVEPADRLAILADELREIADALRHNPPVAPDPDQWKDKPDA